MYIYLLFNQSHYKIGISTNPNRRIKQLQTGCGEKIVLVSKYLSPKFYFQIEKALHSSYDIIRKEGEWFDLEMDQIVKFEENCRKIENNLIFLEKNKI